MIKAENVSVKYLMAYDRIKSMKEYLVQLVKGNIQYEEFWALQDISFEVKKGEVLGIIGHNGAGKSTLLKVISGILKPTSGSVQVNGTVVPMLELGSGFDFDLTGRENVFLNGAILGYPEQFLKEKYGEIVEFSELGQFIDVPLRNYSSGMVMRLALWMRSWPLGMRTSRRRANAGCWSSWAVGQPSSSSPIAWSRSRKCATASSGWKRAG